MPASVMELFGVSFTLKRTQNESLGGRTEAIEICCSIQALALCVVDHATCQVAPASAESSTENVSCSAALPASLQKNQRRKESVASVPPITISGEVSVVGPRSRS